MICHRVFSPSLYEKHGVVKSCHFSIKLSAVTWIVKSNHCIFESNQLRLKSRRATRWSIKTYWKTPLASLTTSWVYFILKDFFPTANYRSASPLGTLLTTCTDTLCETDKLKLRLRASHKLSVTQCESWLSADFFIILYDLHKKVSIL